MKFQNLIAAAQQFLNSRSLRSYLKSWHLAVAFLLIALSLLYAGCTSNRPLGTGNFVPLGLTSVVTLPADAKPTCVVSPAVFNSWFETGSVSLNGVVKPANSVTFPDVPNCSFFQWSEQMYLWLTSPAPARYGPGNRIFDTPAFFDVSPRDANGDRHFIPHSANRIRDLVVRAAQVGPSKLPLVVDAKGEIFEVEPPVFGPSGRRLVLDAEGEEVEIDGISLGERGLPIFTDKLGRVISRPRPLLRLNALKALPPGSPPRVQKFVIGKKSFFLDAAGGMIDVEQGQAGGGDVLQAQNGSLVYYVTTVNDVFAYLRTGAVTGGITPTPTRFPTSQPELDKIIAFAGSKGVTLIDPEALAIEIKSSWVKAAGLPNPGDYITMTATVPTYDQTNPNLWIPTGQETVKLAMVGFHGVGSVAFHPEMIWATFEHQSNLPNDEYQYVNTGNATITVPQSTTGNWLFCANGSTGPFNESHMFFSNPNIQSNPPFAISPSSTLRRKAWGAAFNASPNPLVSAAGSNTEVIAINNSVRGMLNAADVRRNYIMTGSTWTIGGAAPTTRFPGGNEVGTSRSSNATMETYQQGPNNLANGANCFTCHRTNTTDVSHVYPELLPLP